MGFNGLKLDCPSLIYGFWLTLWYLQSSFNSYEEHEWLQRMTSDIDFYLGFFLKFSLYVESNCIYSKYTEILVSNKLDFAH
jgi:hypothetical protein